MGTIAESRGRTIAQVALNYIISKGAIPIPGCRTVSQLEDNIGAMGWRLTDSEIKMLELEADNLGFGFDGAGFKRTSEKFVGYGVSSYGQVKGEAAMMKEIYKRGPIACSFATDDDFMFNYTANAMANDGVFIAKTAFTADDIDHIMEVAGWGETASGTKYWVVRNSWGTYWGSGGWSKIKRETMMAEYECDWAVPEFDDLKAVLAGKLMGDYVHGVAPVDRKSNVSLSTKMVVV